MKRIPLLLFTLVAMTAWAQGTGLYGEWTETDYSEFEITHEYFTRNGTAPSASGGYSMTGFIPVKSGDVIVFSGDRSPGIPFIMGYADKEGNGATVLLGNFDATEATYNEMQGRSRTLIARISDELVTQTQEGGDA